MKRKVFVVCGAFFCLTEALGMVPGRMAELGDGCDLVPLLGGERPSSSLSSEATLNEEFSSFNFDETQFEKVGKGRRRSKSEEIFPVPGPDKGQSRGFNGDRERSRSEMLGYDEVNETDVLAEIERRKRCEQLSDPTENTDDMLNVCARQLSLCFKQCIFQKIKSCNNLTDKLDVLMPEVINYIDNRENQKRAIMKENEELKSQIRSVVEENESLRKQVDSPGDGLVIAKSEEEISFLSAEKYADIESDDSVFINSGVSLDEPSFLIGKFKYVGDMDENLKLAHGKGVFSHIYGTVSFAGSFCKNCLDLSKEVEVKGPCGEKCKFRGCESFGQEAMISMDDISQVSDVCHLGLSTICSKFSNDEGKDGYVLFNPDFVYQGELNGRDITGQGRMFRITGEIQEGEFKNGRYICKK